MLSQKSTMKTKLENMYLQRKESVTVIEKSLT